MDKVVQHLRIVRLQLPAAVRRRAEKQESPPLPDRKALLQFSHKLEQKALAMFSDGMQSFMLTLVCSRTRAAIMGKAEAQAVHDALLLAFMSGLYMPPQRLKVRHVSCCRLCIWAFTGYWAAALFWGRPMHVLAQLTARQLLTVTGLGTPRCTAQPLACS
jgi:hypothetical protein